MGNQTQLIDISYCKSLTLISIVHVVVGSVLNGVSFLCAYALIHSWADNFYINAPISKDLQTMYSIVMNTKPHKISL